MIRIPSTAKFLEHDGGNIVCNLLEDVRMQHAESDDVAPESAPSQSTPKHSWNSEISSNDFRDISVPIAQIQDRHFMLTSDADGQSI